MREFYFDSFTSAPDALQPSEAQQEAADNLVRMLDLSPEGGDEFLQPEHTINPVLQVNIIPYIHFTMKISTLLGTVSGQLLLSFLHEVLVRAILKGEQCHTLPITTVVGNVCQEVVY